MTTCWRLIDNPDVREPLKFLREREIVHFQRFGDALRVVQENLDAKNYYAFNPAIDIRPPERTWRPSCPTFPPALRRLPNRKRPEFSFPASPLQRGGFCY